jgi:hypothetical protein
MVEYQGLSGRAHNQRQSAARASASQTGTPQGAGQVGRRRVGRHHQVQVLQDRRGIQEGPALRVQLLGQVRHGEPTGQVA